MILGSDDNTAIVARFLSGQELGRIKGSAILSCDKWQPFFLQWTGQSLSISKWFDGDQTPLAENDVLNVTWDHVVLLNALSWASTLEAEWLHGHQKGKSLTVSYYKLLQT